MVSESEKKDLMRLNELVRANVFYFLLEDPTVNDVTIPK
jgi:hypothetical protein